MDKKYDFQSTESELERFWEEQGIYKYQHGKNTKIFSIDTPPPTVSGIKIFCATSVSISVKIALPSLEAVIS